MKPAEAMETAIREIRGYREAAIERAVYGAIGAAAALRRVGMISTEDELEWRRAAQRVGEEQERDTQKV